MDDKGDGGKMLEGEIGAGKAAYSATRRWSPFHLGRCFPISCVAPLELVLGEKRGVCREGFWGRDPGKKKAGPCGPAFSVKNLRVD